MTIFVVEKKEKQHNIRQSNGIFTYNHINKKND